MTTRWATAMSSCSWLCRRVEVESVGTLGKQISSANTPRTNPCAVFSLGECHSQPRARHAARQQVVDRTLLRTPPASDNRWAGRYPERHYRGKCRQHRTRSSTKRNAPRGPIPRLCRESPNSLNVEMGRRAGGAQDREHAGALLHPSHLERVEDAERLARHHLRPLAFRLHIAAGGGHIGVTDEPGDVVKIEVSRRIQTRDH